MMIENDVLACLTFLLSHQMFPAAPLLRGKGFGKAGCVHRSCWDPGPSAVIFRWETFNNNQEVWEPHMPAENQLRTSSISYDDS